MFAALCCYQRKFTDWTGFWRYH